MRAGRMGRHSLWEEMDVYIVHLWRTMVGILRAVPLDTDFIKFWVFVFAILISDTRLTPIKYVKNVQQMIEISNYRQDDV